MNTDNICSQCGHSHSDHEADEDGIGNCLATFDEGKATFQCICSGE